MTTSLRLVKKNRSGFAVGQIVYVGFQFTANKQHAASDDKTDELDI